jgi:hypothetical protein
LLAGVLRDVEQAGVPHGVLALQARRSLTRVARGEGGRRGFAFDCPGLGGGAHRKRVALPAWRKGGERHTEGGSGSLGCHIDAKPQPVSPGAVYRAQANAI